MDQTLKNYLKIIKKNKIMMLQKIELNQNVKCKYRQYFLKKKMTFQNNLANIILK